MSTYLARRLVSCALTLFLSSTLVFFVLAFGGGDPAQIILHELATQEMIEALHQRLGLSDPLLVQYLRFLQNMWLRGDLGVSWTSGRPVLVEVGDVLPNTLILTVASLVVAVLVGVPLGVLAAWRQGSATDSFLQIVSLVGVSTPLFVSALVLMSVFGLKLGWFPVFGVGTLRHLVLPSLTLGLYVGALVARMTRSSMIDVLTQDYIVTARAKGLAETVVVLGHGLRNALIPLVTVIGLQFGILMGGTVVTEVVFAWPGIGRLIVGAILGRDFPLVRGAAIVFLGCFVVVNFITDLSYSLVDPRVRYAD